MGNAGTFWYELRRRNVVRAAVLYIGAVWALAQGIAQLGPAFDLPDSVTRWFVVVCSLGFPFWLVLAWLYELTPEGLKREGESPTDPTDARLRGRRLDYAIIAVLSIAVVLLAANTLTWHKGPGLQRGDAEVAALLATFPSASLAVLPLANEGGNRDQQYFSDGLSEELISDLTRIDGLKVIGKYSSFKYRDSRSSPATIGAALGVAHLLGGSVRQQHGQLHVVVSMIRARDGASVWSQTYDRPLKDVFAVQSEIGRAVAAALQVKLLDSAASPDDKPDNGDVETYQLMLQGRAIARRGTEADYRRGLALLQQAVKRSPGYAYAWGTLATYQINLANDYLEGDARTQALSLARTAAARQLVLAPDTAAASITRGYILSQLDSDQLGALAAYRRAISLGPNDGTTMNFLAYQLAVTGQLQEAATWARKAIATDPVRADWYSSLAGFLSGLGDLDAAEQAYRKVLLLQPDYPGVHSALAQIDIRRGNADAAMREADTEAEPDEKTWATTMVKQIGNDAARADAALHDYIATAGATQPYNVASLYALRKQPDEMFRWLDRAQAQHDPNVMNLLGDAFILVYKADPRFAALCGQLGLPAPG